MTTNDTQLDNHGGEHQRPAHPAIYSAKTLWIRKEKYNYVRFQVHLGFHVHAVLNFTVEGVDPSAVPERLHDDALKCMVMLIGGKPVLLHTRPDQHTSAPVARVYRNQKVAAPPEQTTGDPTGRGDVLVEIGAFMQWAATERFNINVVRQAITGKAR